jgi:hypothetical protein
MGTGSFPVVKQPGRGVDHPLPLSAEVKEKVENFIFFHRAFCYNYTTQTNELHNLTN